MVSVDKDKLPAIKLLSICCPIARAGQHRGYGRFVQQPGQRHVHHRLIDVGTEFANGVDSFKGLFFKTGRAMLGIAAVAAEVPRPRTGVGHLVGIAISAREQAPG